MLTKRELDEAWAWVNDTDDLIGAECKPFIRDLLKHIDTLEKIISNVELEQENEVPR